MTNTNIPATKIHSYNVSVAADVGINAAVIFYNICYWVEENTANERNFINGEYWTYNTVNAFKTLFPEMSYEQVRNALRKLENAKYIKSAFLNEDTRDRTKWYTVVDKNKWITSNKCNCENSHMDCDNSQMEYDTSTDVNNIYNNINTDTDNKRSNDNLSNNSHNSLSVERGESESRPEKSKPNSHKKEANDLFERIWKLYPKKIGKGQVSDTQKLKLLKIGYEEIERAVKRCCQYNKDRDIQYWQNGSTFFNSGYIDFLDDNYECNDNNNKPIMKSENYDKQNSRDKNQSEQDFKIKLEAAKKKAILELELEDGYWEGVSDGEAKAYLEMFGIYL